MSTPEASPKPGLKPLRAVLPFLRPYRPLAAGWLLFLMLSSGASLTLPWAVGQMIDHGFSGGDPAAIDRSFLGLFLVAGVLAIATAMRFWFVSMLGESVVADLRRRLYAHLLTLDAAFFERSRSGELLSRITADAELVQTVIGSSVSVALRSVVMLIGASVLLAITSPKLAGLAALVIPLAILPIVFFGRRVRGLSKESQERIADATAQAAESLGAIQTLQAYTREVAEALRFDGAILRALGTARRRISTRAWLTLMVILLVFGAITLVLWVGAKDVLAGVMTAGTLGQFVFYAVTAAASVGALTEVWGEVQRAAGAMERIAELLATEPAVRDRADAKERSNTPRGAIRFEHVRFGYPSRPGQIALDDFSLDIRPGETIALVGPSGAGKSTLFQLLLRFHEAESGRILIDDQAIDQMPLADLRNGIALVPQHPVIFAMDAAANIALGRDGADQAAIEQAARAAQAHEFILAQPGGYAAELGERGVRLSGGQRQRIAIARALLRDAPILLLDEATSALDAQSEAAIQQAIDAVVGSRTTIIIAHRLATVQKADRIVVLDHGRIQAIGSHAELIQAGGLYADLARLQFSMHAD